ncbi:MAG: HAMP domain-containing histidine kinase [Lachnospiraceae bacterium]|nr:HAMP domain-containing histidine kinase [Lachnospiraceae bacterium]
MKLFRKIYLQVFVGMLVLAVGLLAFSAWEVKRQGLEEARRYGTERVERNVREIREKNAEEKITVLESHVRDIVISSELQEYFGSMAVLWKNGEEIRNLSPYFLDWNLLEEMQKKSRLPETEILVEGPFMAGNRRLLIFYKKESGFGAGDEYSFAVFQDVTELYERTKKLILYGAGASGGLLLSIGFLLYRLLYRLFLPLEELKSGAADIAEGKYGGRIPVRRKDEIGDVTASFNCMAQKVEHHVEALREANEKQKQLLGSLAHEMKTPLTAIIGNADLLLTVRLKKEQEEKALSYILNESRRLSRLSEKMLELTGLYENGGMGAVMKEEGLNCLFQRLEASAAFRLKEKGVSLETTVRAEGLSEVMDADLMESLLLNLVDNACKASEPGGNILVSADERGIYVQDFGRGIPEAEIGRVTEAFYMVDKARGRSAGGCGLGLALCSQIARIHGAELLIESREREGTKVSVLWREERKEAGEQEKEFL